MNDDNALLGRYAREGSETAFAELVRRRIDLVYGTALRRTGGDSHRAADVAQQVFTMLARQAHKLCGHPVLAAWLHTATRNAALNLMISEQRRKTRELEAETMEPGIAAVNPGADWDRVRPVLDAAIDELTETDRAAVVLRFLERRNYSEIGTALKVSEDAARMRTDRALDKLRAVLARRGITSTSTALGAVVAGHSAVSAPAGLAAALASESIAAASATSMGQLAASILSLMNTKIIAASLLTAVAGFGLGTYTTLTRTLNDPPPAIETPRHSQLIASLRQSNLSLRAEVDRLNAANAKLAAQRISPPMAAAEATKPAVDSATLQQQQRAVLNNLRQLAAARDQFQLENGRPPLSLDELVGEQKYIRRLLSVEGENYSGVSLLEGQPLIVTTSNGVTVTYNPNANPPVRQESSPAMARAVDLRNRITPAIKKALAAYGAANNGNSAPNEQALIPYFSTPQEGADFVELLEAQKELRR